MPTWFRIFGRTPEGVPPDRDAPQPDPATLWSTAQWTPQWQAPEEQTGQWQSLAGGPATRAARPARLPGSDGAPDPSSAAPTPPEPGPAIPRDPEPTRTTTRVPALVADELPDPAEASALAGAFAVDYLSWDEEDPARRGRVLHDYLSVPAADPAHVGWDGEGRQRADFALPGLVRPDGDGRLLVDVRVRVTPYRSVGEHGSRTPEPEPPLMVGVPAVAPAPTGRGWRALAAFWVRLSVPVVRDGDRLAIDAWEETIGEDEVDVPAEPERGGPRDDGRDHTLADDDPLAESTDGAW